MHVYLKILFSLIKVHILFNRKLRATQSFWRQRVEAEIPKKEISQIYSPDKDCKFWAGLLLRNVAQLLSFIAPGHRLALHTVKVRQTLETPELLRLTSSFSSIC